ncbi:hypothetical protein [Nonomuraea africana]|uniref:Uncharacterized protein n=1 Tax=Nonomuraea africana TaxID=46171 RepID=A0ABR9KNM4_9ACTN|nr:hypothetical protein [Nonomuraea africana]MBE1563626.1 hypothetical protein [Nonomuraea africana]
MAQSLRETTSVRDHVPLSLGSDSVETLSWWSSSQAGWAGRVPSELRKNRE